MLSQELQGDWVRVSWGQQLQHSWREELQKVLQIHFLSNYIRFAEVATFSRRAVFIFGLSGIKYPLITKYWWTNKYPCSLDKEWMKM